MSDSVPWQAWTDLRKLRGSEPVGAADIESWLSVHGVTNTDRKVEIFRIVTNAEHRYRVVSAEQVDG